MMIELLMMINDDIIMQVIHPYKGKIEFPKKQLKLAHKESLLKLEKPLRCIKNFPVKEVTDQIGDIGYLMMDGNSTKSFQKIDKRMEDELGKRQESSM